MLRAVMYSDFNPPQPKHVLCPMSLVLNFHGGCEVLKLVQYKVSHGKILYFEDLNFRPSFMKQMAKVKFAKKNIK